MSKANLIIDLDDSVKNNILFNKLTSLDIFSFEIFKYAIFNDDPPDYISTADTFEYLEGQVPKLESYYRDYVGVTEKQILSYANGEKAIKISELIGVGVGLKYVTELLKLNRNTIQKIKQKGNNKRMDFSLNKDEVKLEAKGTLHEDKINSIKKDILLKKKEDNSTCLKIGTITIVRKKESNNPSKLLVCDEFNHIDKKILDIQHYFDYYKFMFSLILDNSSYNVLIRRLNSGVMSKYLIRKRRIYGRYKYKDKTYLGNFFDRRLILEKVKRLVEEGYSKNNLFEILTKEEGITKYFVGVSEDVIDALNDLDTKRINEFNDFFHVQEDLKRVLLLDNDGILIIRSDEFADKQIEEGLSENEVRRRLGFELNYLKKEPQKCGAPCRSKEIEGKPCEIKTYRGYCHFHR